MPVVECASNCEKRFESNGILSELRVDHERILSALHEEHQRALCALQNKLAFQLGQTTLDAADIAEPGSYQCAPPDNSASSQTFVVGLVNASRAHRDESDRTSLYSLEAPNPKSSSKACVTNLFDFVARPHTDKKSSDEILSSLAASDTHFVGSPKHTHLSNRIGPQKSNKNNTALFSGDETMRLKTLCNRKSSWSALRAEVNRVKTMRDTMVADRLDGIGTASRDHVTSRRSGVGSTLAIVRRSKAFEHLCGSIILFNCVIMGAMSQFNARDHRYINESPIYLDIADKFCSVWFLFELALRLTVGPCMFFCGRDRSWNVFDVILVSFDVSDNTLRVAVGSGGTPVKNLVALRLLRIFRVLRIVRLLKFCRELQLMLLSIRKCGRTLVWALVLVALIVYLFSMYFLQVVTDHLMISESGGYDAILQKQWGSLFAASYTLFAAMCGGVSWMEVADPLIDIHWVHGLALLFYVFFTLFVVTNIITSIFVDTAIQSGNQDREEVIARKLVERDEQLAQMASIFQDADEDVSGLISLKQFQRHMRDPRVRAHLRSVDLDVTEATSLFILLDTDGSEHISITEFVFGCMRLKGTARSVDLAILMHDSKVLHAQLDAIVAQSCEIQQVVEMCLETLATTTRVTQSSHGESSRPLLPSGQGGLSNPEREHVDALVYI